MSSRWLFDTSVYVLVLRDVRFAREFRPRYVRDIPRTHFSSVVIQELLAGARTARHRAQAEELFAPFERARRIVTPTHAVWKEVGELIAALRHGAPRERSPSLVNDALIFSCDGASDPR